MSATTTGSSSALRLASLARDPDGRAADERDETPSATGNPVSSRSTSGRARSTTPEASTDPHGDVSVDELALAEELSGSGERAVSADIAEYALWLGDDALILAQQLGAWITYAPELEEDVALGNIALDLLGHARSFLRYAGSWDGRSEDDLAYFRDESEFRSCWLVEQPNGDFAQTIARQLLVSTYMLELYSALRSSTDGTFAAIAEKAVKEVDYHRDHAVQWTLRLAGGTDESRARIIRAFGDVWPYAAELFRDDALIERLGAAAVRPSSLRARFDAVIEAVFAEAELDEELRSLSGVPGPGGSGQRAGAGGSGAWGAKGTSAGGGRHGSHATGLGHLLSEMQVLARRHPGATW